MLRNFIRIVNHNYELIRNLPFQKQFLEDARIHHEIFNISINNLERHINQNRLFFNKQNYNKHIIEETDDLNFCIITWNKNALTKLHTHSKNCLYKVYIGEFEEIILSPNNNFKKTKEIIKPEGIKVVNEGEYHQMRNLTEQYGLSFHIYDKK